MYIANTITIPADDIGYTLAELLVTAGYSWDPPANPRFACLKLSCDTATQLVYVVPKKGAYTAVANVPTDYGWSFANQGALFEMAYPQNSISMYEIVVGGNGGETLQVFAYQI